MMNRLILAAAIFAGVTPGLALAQGGGGGRGMLRADTNGDGMVSRDEASAEANRRFAALDLNHDGVLSADEMTGPGARMLARADRDGDGKVTKAEFAAWSAERFARMDANGDGMISADELRAAMDRVRDARARSDPADAIGPPPRPAAAPTPPGQ